MDLKKIKNLLFYLKNYGNNEEIFFLSFMNKNESLLFV